MINGTLLNFSKRYQDNLRVIFDQLHLGLDVLSNKKTLERYLVFIVHFILAVSAFLNVYLLKKIPVIRCAPQRTSRGYSSRPGR